ncbi:MAG: HK97 family phage prohead protease [Actinomycetota bacterium]|nr:HK97 family phage prohead protease [Actinomycetota bacterium]
METGNRPTLGETEERAAPDLLSADGKKIHGRIPYNAVSRDMGGWKEVIEPGAFNGAQMDDLVATVDHAGVPLGRHPATLELEDRADGLAWSVEPPKSRQDIVEAVQRGDLKAGSWRMQVAKDEWRGNTRHVLEVAVLRDVSIVTRPAYGEAAQVEYRSQPDPAAGQEETMADKAEKDTTTAEAVTESTEERTEAPVFQTLAQAFEDRGFFTGGAASVTWDEYRSFTWAAGTTLTDLAPLRTQGVGFGYDQRWLYPVLPTTAVSDATTAVQYLRQSARTLAGTAVIRPLDAVTTKPETSTTVEFKTLQLEQVASVQSNIPRIHAAQPMFQSLVEQDLRYSINDGLDEIARRGIVQAGTIVKGTDDILEVTRKAVTLVQTDGYSPSVLAIDPAGAQALDLLRTPGTEKHYIWDPGRGPGSGPWGLQIRVWKNAGTAALDADAYGRMYISPVELRSFEADGGLTNKQNVRMECAAGYTVERIPAARRIT